MRRLLFVLALLSVIAVHAAARAGGGQSYSGSSSGSSYSYSGGSGGSSNSGDLVFVIYLILKYPIVGIPLTLLFIYSGVWRGGWKVRPLPGGSSIGIARAGPRQAEEVTRLRARDPGFSEPEFLRRAAAAFLKIQEAWSAGDMAAVRAFISDGVRERFERQLAGLKARGLRNIMEGVEVQGIELLACRSDKHFDELWVRVAAVASDRMVDAQGNTVSGSPGRAGFEEVWTFLRRPGAKTLKRPGLIEGNCPSCGAPLPIADAAHCGSCKTWVNSGEYDWVLTEITQSCEWLMREPARDVDGWRMVAAADPVLNLPVLEDRASVIFWRWLDARRSADPAPLRPVATETFCRAFATGGSAAFDDAAVGSVEVVAFEDTGFWTRAHIAVKWSGGGELRTHFFVLNREAGAKTDGRQGLRTARCPSCGAPPSERSEAACAYCSSPLNDGKRDWVLTEIVPFGLWRRPAAAPGVVGGGPVAVAGLDWGADLSSTDAFAVLAGTILADGEETLAERAFLEAYAKSRGLPPAKSAQIAGSARAGTLDAPRAVDGGQAESMLRGMIRMSLADGVVSQGERAALQSFAARFGLRPDDVSVMVGEERSAMARSSRSIV